MILQMGCEAVDNQNQNRVYVTMMVDALKKKENVLTFLLEKTREQEMLLRSDELDEDEFSETIEEKGNGLDDLTHYLRW